MEYSSISCYFLVHMVANDALFEDFEVVGLGNKGSIGWDKSELDINPLKIGHVLERGLHSEELSILRLSAVTPLLISAKMDKRLLAGQFLVYQGEMGMVASYRFHFRVSDIRVGVDSSNYRSAPNLVDLMVISVVPGTITTAFTVAKRRLNPRRLRPD